jgi:hypothetical protein
LTSEAIRTSGEEVIKDIVAAIERAEETAKALRAEGDALIEAIRGQTYRFADKVSRYVTNCQEVKDLFQVQQVKAFDPDNFLDEKKKAPREVPVLITEEHLATEEEIPF